MHSSGDIHPLSRCYIIFAFFLPSSIALPLLPPPEVLHCEPTTWQDIFLFFLLNYVVHAATTPPQPGERSSWGIAWKFIFLLFPFTGIFRSAFIIFKDCCFGEDELGKALAVGALTVAARTELWEPPDHECFENMVCAIQSLPSYFKQDARSAAREGRSNPYLLLPGEIDGAESPTAVIKIPATPDDLVDSGSGPPSLHWWGEFILVNYRYSTIHGDHTLPDGYQWVIPSPAFCFRLVERLKGRSETQISCSQNMLQIITSIVQLALSSITIYHTRGPQLRRYGYASFGLSVIPFTFMSFIKFICVGSTGGYPSLFMLQTSTLQEAKGRSGAAIFGEVGILPMAQDHQHNNRQSSNLAGLERAHDEADEPLADGVMASRDGRNIPACLWAEDNRKYLCVKIGGLTRRFKLVKSNEGPTFIFLIHPMDQPT